jgi:hypothetical protein
MVALGVGGLGVKEATIRVGVTVLGAPGFITGVKVVVSVGVGICGR